MTINEAQELTPGQRRTAAARATRAEQANAKAAARLREAGYVVISAQALGELMGAFGTRALTPWASGYLEGVAAVAEVSQRLQANG